MAIIIDRRKNPSGKSHINRQRFIQRAKDQIRDTVRRSVTNKNIRDIGSNENVNIRSKDVSEPTFRNDGSSGNHKRVLPGNKEYSQGDKIPKPRNGAQQTSGKKGGQSGDTLDDFEFTLTRDEFLDCLFEDLELPDFVKETIKATQTVKHVREGLTSNGSPANLNILRTFKNSMARRTALTRPSDELIEEVRLELENAQENKKAELQELLELLIAKQKRVPYIDETDLKYNLWQKKPSPQNQAVMFCLMDVSGSMGNNEKEIAKRFFLLLYLFLERRYEKIDLRFIRHTTEADDVDEHTFFYDRKSGGTKISSGLTLIKDIIDAEYHISDWNIYIAQVTDGDNDTADNVIVDRIIRDYLQERVQYFAYVQIDDPDHDMHASTLGMFGGLFGFGYSAWPIYIKLSADFKNIVCKHITDQADVWKIFIELFKK